MKYFANETTKQVNGGIAFIHVELPELVGMPFVMAHVAEPYTEEELKTACEYRLTQMKEVMTATDSNPPVFDDTFEKVTSAEAVILEASK